MHIGLVGLGKMGFNMRARLRASHIEVTGYDRNPELSDVASMAELVAAVPGPRLVWVMVPSGAVTTAVITELAELLEPGDMVVDGGNSRFTEDQKHAELLAASSIRFIDVGVSGGVWGLENGYGLMAGGAVADVALAMPVLDALRPEGEREDSFVHVGAVGAGHYAKMVHNGIEYGLMQSYAEGYELLAKKDIIEDVPGTFRAWQKGTVVRSWLLDLMVKALAEDPGLESIDGYVEDSGEGRWTVEEAIASAVPAPAITAALFARFASREDNSRPIKWSRHCAINLADIPPSLPVHKFWAPLSHMFLEHLSLTDFRSYAQVELSLTPGVTVLIGANGLGKTNLVESIGYLSTLSSHRVSSDGPLLRFGTERALIRAQLVRAEQKVVVEIEINAARANRARINRANPVRARDILGICRTVLFAPEDLALVKGDPGNRRRFLDDLLVVLMPRHAGTRSDYEKVLKQRNALLKSARTQHFSRAGISESQLATLEVWDQHMAAAAANLLAARLELIGRLRPHLAEAYAQLTDGSKLLRAEYRSSLDQPPPAHQAMARDGDAPALDADFGVEHGVAANDLALLDIPELTRRYCGELAASRTRELERGMSLVGPHRDELDLLLGQAPARGYASHGESWSIALALRLASFHVLDEDKHVAGNQPILILDDVFAELDVQRRRKLATMVSTAEQVLVTAAVGGDIPEELAGSKVQVIPGGVLPHE